MQEDIVRAPLSRQTRIRLIGERGSTPQHSHMVLFLGRYREFPVTKVPNEALVYQVENGRLAAELEEHAAATGVSVEEFRRGAGTLEVQVGLHRLLVAKAKDPHGPIFAELERLGQQTEPLSRPLRRNGDQRQSAPRGNAQLAKRIVTECVTFSEVAVAVLSPDTEPQEIEYVEAALQMAPETKLQYGWLDRRLKLRKQREVLRLPVEHVMAAYRIENPADIAREIAELALAEFLSQGLPARSRPVIPGSPTRASFSSGCRNSYRSCRSRRRNSGAWPVSPSSTAARPARPISCRGCSPSRRRFRPSCPPSRLADWHNGSASKPQIGPATGS